ncbi:MAG TPA: hypothetical protein PKZ41_01300 [Candidatus Omnitrophota bacterium]|nr:hypothetical protein [Candidatus Omnitrophota bacterium]
MPNNAFSKILAVMLFLGVFFYAGVFYGEDETEPEKSLRRDPFVPLVGVDTVKSRSGIAGIFTIVDAKFQGIATGSEGKKAIVLNGEILEEGQTVGLVELVEVGDNKAVISIDGAVHEILLYEHKVQQ